MHELDAQSLVVRQVREEGGAATKISHRFIKGVCDLMVKLPGHDMMLLEAKYKKVVRLSAQLIRLEVTKLQEEYLMSYRFAGSIEGVISFVSVQTRVFVRIYPITDLIRDGYMTNTLLHVPISRSDRGPLITVLKKYYQLRRYGTNDGS